MLCLNSTGIYVPLLTINIMVLTSSKKEKKKKNIMVLTLYFNIVFIFHFKKYFL